MDTHTLILSIVFSSVRATLPQKELVQCLVLGRRYTGPEAEAVGIVNESCPLPALRERAIAAASRLAGDGLDRKTLHTLKKDLYRNVYQMQMEPLKFYSML